MRNPKNVYLSATFIPFTEERLPPIGTKSLLGQAFFHIFWAECQVRSLYDCMICKNRLHLKKI